MRRKVGTVMRISTFWFCMKQGLVNICRNIWFSLASTAIISACIFLFCVFFSVITNIEYMVRTAETTMGITVFFDENLTEDEIKDIGAKIESDKSGMIKEIKFVSAEEAWDGFKTEYFGEDEALAEGFADDNPLAGSSSYEIRLNNITDQDGMVAYLESIDGVRKVNYSNSAATGLASFNKILGLLFGVLIAMLLAVAVFLISNTISVAAEFRKNENRIMRLIGATNFMIRAPFVVEGTILGLVGAAIPLGVMLFVYRQTVEYVMNRFELLSGIIQFLPLGTFYPMMAAIALALGGSKHADMAERQRIANETGADILVSIHQNAFPSAKAKGAQVFYHKSSERGKILAECVQESLKSRVDGSNRRMAKENKEYYILRTTQIPAVIVECGFLSNAEEERLLNDTAYQERLAWAVYCGILDYFEKISII